MVDDSAFLKKLQLSKDEGGYGYKIKGDGPLAFHLGCDYYRDKDGTLVYQPKKYIEKMMASYDCHFQGKPKQYSSLSLRMIIQNWMIPPSPLPMTLLSSCH